jgi:aspartyl-tRNA(Asn)/glutamyl-tRNA(Gln) amidotransferase subunit B
MEEGSFRVDVNISVHEAGEPLGARCEVKNLNSFKSISRAIDFESKRQRDLLSRGLVVLPETRLFNAATGETVKMRNKDSMWDYRFMPDPDIPDLHVRVLSTLFCFCKHFAPDPVQVPNEFIESVRLSIPPLPDEIASKLMSDHGLKAADARWIANDSRALNIFTEAIAVCEDAELAASWVINELPHAIATLPETGSRSVFVSGQRLGALLLLLKQGQVAGPQAKKTLKLMCTSDDSAEAIVDSNSWRQQKADADAIKAVCLKVIAANPEKVVELEQGRLRLFGFFVGECSKLLGETCDPKIIANELRLLVRVPEKEKAKAKM